MICLPNPSMYCLPLPSCKFLSERLSPVIPCVGAVLFVFVVSMLLHTSFSDPGIIPRATPEEALYTERQIGKQVCVCDGTWHVR